MIDIAVINYGAGNLASVTRALHVSGARPRIVTTPDGITDARAILVPGVGHFSATAALNDEWRGAVRLRISAGAAVLGICLGMQWLFAGSDEAPALSGLGAYEGRCFRLQGSREHGRMVKIPHVGWNSLHRTASPSRLLSTVPSGAFVYFTHTFAAPVGSDTVAVTTHGGTFTAVAERARVFGTQWHPEKSGDIGLSVLRSFVTIATENA